MCKNVHFSFSENSFGKTCFVTEKKIIVTKLFEKLKICDDIFFIFICKTLKLILHFHCMENNGNKIKQKISKKYYCEICHYTTDRKSNINNHYNSLKHKKEMIGTKNKQILSNNNYMCENCKKTYQTTSGLWKHNKNCSTHIENKNDNQIVNNKCQEITTELVIEIIKQNQELQKQNNEVHKQNLELQKQMIELSKNIGNNNNNRTKFNLNFFLNETCKDAMNITDFVNSIKLQLTDLENVGHNGYVNGISNIIVKNLNALEVTKRPLHCSDIKREIMYVKDENRWEKEKEKLENAIKKVSYKNVLKILEWKKEHPGCEYSCNKENDKYLQIVNESMGALKEEEKMKNINEIITRIAKEVVIEKET